MKFSQRVFSSLVSPTLNWRSLGVPRVRGITLVELMVALAVGLLLLLAVVSIFASSKQTYRMQEAMARVQESGRIALELIAREVREAGYYGCVGNLVAEEPRSDGVLDAGRMRNTLNPDPPLPPAFAFDFSRPLFGHDAVGNAWLPALPSGFPFVPIEGTDVITVSAAQGSGEPVTAHPGNPNQPPGSANLQTNAGNGFQQGEILVVSDCETAAVFQVTNNNPSTSGTLVHNTGNNPLPGNWTQALGRNFTGGEVYRTRQSTFYVGNGAANRPALFRNADELVEGVVELQIRYGVDTNNNGRIDQYQTAAQVQTNGVWPAVRAVRVSLLVRAEEPGVMPDPVTNLAFDEGVFSAPVGDRRMYRAFSTTIGVRNRLL